MNLRETAGRHASESAASTVMAAIDEVIRRLTSARRIMVAVHPHPDPDALGSALALGLALDALGKSVTYVTPHHPSASHRFLPGIERFTLIAEIPASVWRECEVFVALDCGSPDRVEPMLARLGPGCRVCAIDHHAGNQGFGAHDVIDADAPATATLVLRLLQRARWPLSEAIALNLYVALVTDTGSFRYSNTTIEAHHHAALLIKAGVQPADVSDRLFHSTPRPLIALQAWVMTHLRFTPAGKVAYFALPSAVREQTGAPEADVGNLVLIPRSIEGVDCAFSIMESENGVRISLRANHTLDVCQVAQRFGGGGHKKAAGATIAGDLDTVTGRVLDAVTSAYLDAVGSPP